MTIHRTRAAAAALTALAATLATAGAAHATAAPAPQPRAVSVPPVFSDGSFETPTAPAKSFTTRTVGQTIGPWTVTKGSVDHIGAGYWAAAEGDQSVDLNGGQEGGVAQTFATTPGTRYRVTYSVAGNTAGGPAVKTGRVLVNGDAAQSFSFDSTGKTTIDMGYSAETFEFSAAVPQTTLTFDSTTAGSAYGPVLDAVTVTAECCDKCPNPAAPTS
ncbi:MAG: choice-of-anchor C family protein [Catenulispora sp.]